MRPSLGEWVGPHLTAPRPDEQTLSFDGTSEAHDPGVLPQGMTFNAADLLDAYVTGARSARGHHPVTDTLIARAADAYVKHAHLTRLDAA